MGLSPVGLFAPIDAYHGALIGSASAPGSAGAVNVDVSGIIETQGAAAHGILATSAGGGKKLAATPNDSADLALGRSTGGDVTIDTAGSDFDTVLGIYTEDSGELVPIGCVDDVDSLQARITISTDAGVTYWIQAGGLGSSSGTLVLTVN